MPNPYMDALKKFNEGKTGWCVPRKGTADYQKVMNLMKSTDTDSFINQESNPRRALKPKAKPSLTLLLCFLKEFCDDGTEYRMPTFSFSLMGNLLFKM